jgi:hypothetical protein
VLADYSRRDLIRLLTEQSDYAVELRSSTPFTRALSNAERITELSAFSRGNSALTAA